MQNIDTPELTAEQDKTRVSAARIAGILYLLIIAAGLFGEIAVRGALVVADDAVVTVSNIAANPWLFKAGMVFDSIMILSDIGVAVLLYTLLKAIHPAMAMAMTVFRLMQAGLLAAGMLNFHAVSLLVLGSDYAIQTDTETMRAQVMLFLNLHAHNYDYALIFFAFANLMLGPLLIRSEEFSRFTGYALVVAAFVYLCGSLLRLLWPHWYAAFQPFYLIALLAELWFAFRLLRFKPAPPEELKLA